MKLYDLFLKYHELFELSYRQKPNLKRFFIAFDIIANQKSSYESTILVN